MEDSYLADSYLAELESLWCEISRTETEIAAHNKVEKILFLSFWKWAFKER